MSKEMNTIEKRVALLDARKMSSGMKSKLATVVNTLIEPELRNRVKSWDVLTLKNNAYQRKSMATIFDCALMPQNGDGHETLGQFLRTVDDVQALVSYLKGIKQVEEKNGGWANTEQFCYLCDCIDLMLYVDDLVRIGDQTQHPQAEIKVFCQCCYRYAESKEVGASKNLRLCRVCREVEKDGQDYKRANQVIDHYLKIINIKGLNKKSVWLNLKAQQVKENRHNLNLKKMRELASDSCLSPVARFTAIIELIKLIPRLRHKLMATPIQATNLDDLIAELLTRMEFRYSGIKDYFIANPGFLCGTLIRYDCYLLMTGVIGEYQKNKQAIQANKIVVIREYLKEGMSKTDIADKIGITRGHVYKLIKKHKLKV